MEKTLERIYWNLKKLEHTGKDKIFKQLDEIVNAGRLGFETLISYGSGFEELYETCVGSIVIEQKDFLSFISEIKKSSQQAYDFLTCGHDILNISEYIKFKGLDCSTKFKKYNDFIDFSIYLRYAFRKIINESDEEKKKSMLKGILGI